MVAMSVLGNFISIVFAVSRVKQEIAKLRILPFSKFWAKQSHYDTPVGALILHWIFTSIAIVRIHPSFYIHRVCILTRHSSPFQIIRVMMPTTLSRISSSTDRIGSSSWLLSLSYLSDTLESSPDGNRSSCHGKRFSPSFAYTFRSTSSSLCSPGGHLLCNPQFLSMLRQLSVLRLSSLA